MASDKIERLEKKLKTLRSKSDKGAAGRKIVDLLNTLAREYIDSVRNCKRAARIAQQALVLAKKIDYKLGVARSYQIMGSSYELRGNYNAAKKWQLKALGMYKKIGEQRGIARSYHNLGHVYIHNGNYDQARKYYSRALKLNARFKAKKSMGHNYGGLGRICDWKGEHENALAYYMKSLIIAQHCGDKNSLVIRYNDLGIVNEKLGNYRQALEYHFKALEISEEIGSEERVADCYHNIASVYYRQSDQKLALEYYSRALKTVKQLDDPIGTAAACMNIGIIYHDQRKITQALKYKLRALKISEDTMNKRAIIFCSTSVADTYCAQGAYDSALQYYLRSQSIATRIGDKPNIACNHIGIGTLKFQLNDYDSAFNHLRTGLQIAQKIGVKKIEIAGYESLSKLFEARQDYEKALDYHKKYTDLKEEIFNAEKSKQIADMRTRYETEKKEKEAEIYRLKNVDLSREIKQRKKAEKELKEHSDHLEEMVAERTSKLKKEIAERKHAERALLSYQKQLRSLAHELSLVEERQRRNIATNLHDNISQSLMIVKSNLEMLASTTSNKKVQKKIKEIQLHVRQMIERTRSMTFEISPPVLYELGLEPAMEWLVERFQEQHGIACEFHDDGLPKPISKDWRSILFQSTRELLANVRKHAKANKVLVSMRRDGKHVRITVEDDGVGFNLEILNLKIKKNEGFGLFNLRERLTHLQGNIEIDSKKGKGTTVTLFAPLKRNKRATTRMQA